MSRTYEPVGQINTRCHPGIQYLNCILIVIKSHNLMGKLTLYINEEYIAIAIHKCMMHICIYYVTNRICIFCNFFVPREFPFFT